MSARIVGFTLNGSPAEVIVRGLTTLDTVLRDQLGHTAVKVGCRQGGCGSCTVLVDGELTLSCLLPVQEADGREVRTVAGLAEGEALHPLQQAFLERFAAQCGFCTPGMLMAASALLARDPEPSRETIVEAIEGNVCRCTGYAPIVDAIADAAARLAADRNGRANGGAAGGKTAPPGGTQGEGAAAAPGTGEAE